MSTVQTIKKAKTFTKIQQQVFDSCLLTSVYDYIVVKTGRQIGKTTVCMYIALNWCLKNDNYKVGIYLPVYKQCRKIFKGFKNGLTKYEYAEFNQSELIITFANGSSISFHSAENDNCRGFTYDSIICDEAGFIKSDIFTAAILPTVAVSISKKGGKCVLISTPKTRNFFYDYCVKDIKGKHVITATTEQGGLISKDFLDNIRQTTPEHIFKNEYMAEFMDSGNGLFRYKDCLMDKAPTDISYCVGAVDWGVDNDYTVLTILNGKGEMVFHKRWGGDGSTAGDLMPVIREIAEIAKKHKCILYSEKNGIGIMPTQELKKLYSNTKEFITSTNKKDVIHKLMMNFAEGSIKILNIPVLLDELDAFSQEINIVTGKVTYGAPGGVHDDCVMSLAIANYNRIGGQRIVSGLKKKQTTY